MKGNLVLVAGLVSACGGGSSRPVIDLDAAGSAAIDAADQAYVTLIERDWTITAPTDDQWVCRRIQVQTELWISSFHPIAPLGTLDETLTVSDGTPQSFEMDNYPCAAALEDHTMLYVAAAGTGDVTFPAGYAVHLVPGQWINLNIHLVKPGGASTGTSGVQIKTVDAATNPRALDMMFIGNTKFTIAHDGLDADVVAGCNVPTGTEWDMFALWPRMHRTGKHQKLDVFHGSASSHDSLMDAAFSLMTDQSFQTFAPPVHVSAAIGDHLQLTCTFNNNNTNNPGGAAVMYGDRLADENCFNAFYKYPAGGAPFDCAILQ